MTSQQFPFTLPIFWQTLIPFNNSSILEGANSEPSDPSPLLSCTATNINKHKFKIKIYWFYMYYAIAKPAKACHTCACCFYKSQIIVTWISKNIILENFSNIMGLPKLGLGGTEYKITATMHNIVNTFLSSSSCGEYIIVTEEYSSWTVYTVLY